MMKDKSDMDKWYQEQDPWKYKTNPFDIERKEIILNRLIQYGHYFNAALDIGCGEGWITTDLPADYVCGYDISDNALSRLPDNIIRLSKKELDNRDDMKFDLILATGVFYKDYDWKWIVDKINQHATGIVLTCNIKQSEVSQAIKRLKNQIHYEEFEYRYEDDNPAKPRMIEVLRVFWYGESIK